MHSSTEFTADSPGETFDIGEQIGSKLAAGDVVLLTGGLGAGKTLFTKGVLHALDYDVDEVTSPSFALVNLYKTPEFDVYHIDLWRLHDSADAAFAVGLDEILDNDRAVVIIEWAERLKGYPFSSRSIKIDIKGDGDDARTITVSGIE